MSLQTFISTIPFNQITGVLYLILSIFMIRITFVMKETARIQRENSQLLREMEYLRQESRREQELKAFKDRF